MCIRPMSYLRCRKVLSHSFLSSTSLIRTSRWSQLRQLQTRGKQNPRQQPSRALPQHTTSSQPLDSQQILDETQYPADVNKSNHEYQEEPEFPNIKVRFLRPAIWALTVSSGIYISFAYFEAKKELKPISYNPFEAQLRPRRPASPPTPTEVVTRAWRESDPISRLSWSLIGTSGVVHLSSLLIPRVWSQLWHVPVYNRNFSLLTSTFVHSGPFHLGVNMWAAYQFLPPTGYSALFRGDTNHMISFYLSTGIIAGLFQHVASTLFKHGRPHSPFIPSGGASGALFAVFGAFCMQYPHQGVGIIFIPYHIEAQYFLPLIMLFDLVGMVRGFSFVSLGHAAHLGGATVGAAYSFLDGHNNVWRPLVNFWKRRLQGKAVL